MDENAKRRRRALLRAQRRGSLEMDLTLGPLAQAWLDAGGDVDALDRLCACDDAEIADWLAAVAAPPAPCAALVAFARARLGRA